jgi:hypothetical protein
MNFNGKLRLDTVRTVVLGYVNGKAIIIEDLRLFPDAVLLRRIEHRPKLRRSRPSSKSFDRFLPFPEKEAKSGSSASQKTVHSPNLSEDDPQANHSIGFFSFQKKKQKAVVLLRRRL